MTDKKISIVKKWEIEHTKYTDGTIKMKRTCDGFSSYELLGIVSFVKSEIIDQITGKYKPDIIKRNYIKPEKKELLIENLGFRPRLTDILVYQIQVTKISELSLLSKRTLLRYRGIGDKAIRDINNELELNGYRKLV